MKAIIKLIRPKEWVKNLFLFIPAFFAGDIFAVNDILRLLVGFMAFSLTASAVYIINDYNDIEMDRLHHKKKFRPLASGEVNKSVAIVLILVLAISGLVAAWLTNLIFFYLLLFYFVLNIFYSFGLKNIPILDLFIVASGFILRTYSGGFIAGVPVSHWLAIMIMLLALFLVIAKRRDDLMISAATGTTVRKASASYNMEFINSCLTLLSAVIIVAYIMYTVSPEITNKFTSDYLFVTTVFVIAGIMRYLQITFVEQKSGSPTSVLYKDKFILITIVCWLITFYFIIYDY